MNAASNTGKVGERTPGPVETDNYSVRSSGAGGRQICLCEISVRGRPYNETYDEAIANAAFIVTAWNAHDDLIAEVANLRAWQRARLEQDDATREKHDDLLDLAKNVGGFDDSLLLSADLHVLRGALREYRDQARTALSQLPSHRTASEGE